MDQKEEQKQEKELTLKDLPDELRKKYKNHPMFQKQNIKHSKPILSQEEKQQLDKLKNKKEKSLEERLSEVKVQQTEKAALEKAFRILVGTDKDGNIIQQLDKTTKKKLDPTFDAKRINTVLSEMGITMTKAEINLMLWEIDENLDTLIGRQEFENMYKRCIMEQNFLEPKSIFHLVQFLMYYSNSTKEDDFIQGSQDQKKEYTISVEDTLELIYVRKGRNQLDSEIEAIFGKQEKNQDGTEKRITFSEYLEKINQRAISERKLKQQVAKEKRKNMGLNTEKE